MQDTSALYAKGMKLYHERNLGEAEKVFREILTADSRHAQSLHMMAVMGHEVERHDFAEELVRMAIAEDNNNANFYYTLGLILNKRKKFDDAMIAFQEAVKLSPDHIDALLNLATICRNLGAITRNDNMLDAALHFYTKALAIRADEDTYESIGYLYKLKGLYPESIAACEACLRRYPNSVQTLLTMGYFRNFYQKYEEALEYFNRAFAIDPNNAHVHTNMASTLKNLGKLDESIKAQKRAVELSPNDAWIHSNLILTMLYADSVTPDDLAQESRRFGERLADPLRRDRPFKNNKSPNRKLNIGYISADFRNHAVSYFLSPIFECDKRNFKIFAYSKNEKDDEVTEHIKKYFDHWRDIRFADDNSAADMIEKDKIDILVDLAGHTAKNGLMIFARKPAPIQVTWLGYTATTGMKAMDYRITDPYAEPIGMTEHLNTETLWRLPHIFAAYNPPKNSPPVINHPPFKDNGYITFGCFNNFTKVTDPVLKAWAKIMEQVPDSRLLLEIAGIANDKIKSEVEARLSQWGIPLNRVTLEPRLTTNQYILYNRIDIALDPFPAVGGTTSMDTLWMGVPFITLAGRHFGSRMGVSILTNAGLPELISQNVDEYVSLAVNLAKDRDRLERIRHNLRDRVEKTPLMNQKVFAKDMEDAYRQMWKLWAGAEKKQHAQ